MLGWCCSRCFCDTPLRDGGGCFTVRTILWLDDKLSMLGPTVTCFHECFYINLEYADICTSY
uniref:Uncharacterized protein n=1 Tax=Oryza brachyantha TaxID=4533 RepID=J3LWL1_ORYBR